MVSTLQIQPVQFKFKLFVLITVVEAVVIAVLETFFPLVWTALIWLGISLFFDWNDLTFCPFIFNYSWSCKIQKPKETWKVNLEPQLTVYLSLSLSCWQSAKIRLLYHVGAVYAK